MKSWFVMTLEEQQFKNLGIERYNDVVTIDMVHNSKSLLLYNEGFYLTPKKYWLIKWVIWLGKRKWGCVYAIAEEVVLRDN